MSAMIETIEDCGLTCVDSAIQILLESGRKVDVDVVINGKRGLSIDSAIHLPYADQFDKFVHTEDLECVIGESYSR